MPAKRIVISPGILEGTVVFAGGRIEDVPGQWTLLPPGDAALTRRVKAAGPSWTLQEQKGRRTFSRGVYADAGTIARIRAELESERSTESYARRRVAGVRRRERKQEEYVDSFRTAVLDFLKFDERYCDVADRLAAAVTEHATPVGSGTVARTHRISAEQRAASAVIAWLRHQTTFYDHMQISRRRGERQRVRHMLAEESRALLFAYRNGGEVGSDCPLKTALQ